MDRRIAKLAVKLINLFIFQVALREDNAPNIASAGR